MSPLAAAQVTRCQRQQPARLPARFPPLPTEAPQPPRGGFCQRPSTERVTLWGPSRTPVGHMARSLPWSLQPQPRPETSSKVAASRLSLKAPGCNRPSGGGGSAPGDARSRPSGPGVPAPGSHVRVRTAAGSMPASRAFPPDARDPRCQDPGRLCGPAVFLRWGRGGDKTPSACGDLVPAAEQPRWWPTAEGFSNTVLYELNTI